MTRPSKINEPELAKDLRRGMTDKEAAKKQDVTRQAIQLKRKLYTSLDPSDPRYLSPSIQRVKMKPGPKKGATRAEENQQPTWEQLRDFMLNVIELAGRVPELEIERDKYKRGYENIMQAAQSATVAEQKAIDEERRYKLAIQRGHINRPLTTKLTEHIDCATELTVANSVPRHNIMLGDFYFN